MISTHIVILIGVWASAIACTLQKQVSGGFMIIMYAVAGVVSLLLV